jgi:hypothetical protein
MKIALTSLSLFLIINLQAQRVLMIGIDGMRSDAMTAAVTPSLDALIAEGIYSPDALNSDITISGPGWSAILTGARSPKHLVTGNDFTINNYADYPNFLKRLEDMDSGYETVSICQWDPINDYIIDGAADEIINTGSSAQTRDEAVGVLTYDNPDAVFLHFDDVDYAGHGSGFSPENSDYISTIEMVDAYVGDVMYALTGRVNYAEENWLVLMTSDHGGVGYSHGGTSIEHQNVAFIVSGPAVETQLIEKLAVDTLDAPLNCLGVAEELSFAGAASDYAAVAPNSLLDFGSDTDFSVEMRIRTFSTPDVAMIGNKDWDTGLNPGFVFSFKYANGPEWKVNIGDGSERADADASPGLDDGEWHMLSATFDRDGMMRLYTDGVFDVQEDISSVGDINTGAGLFIGADIFGAYAYTGRIAEVRVFEGVLDEETVDAWACTSLDETHVAWEDLIGYWPMDEADAAAANGVLVDASGGGLDATYNGPTWGTPEPIVVWDYSSTPRIEDMAVTALTHMCMEVEADWQLDGQSWVDPCAVAVDELRPGLGNSELLLYPNPLLAGSSLSIGALVEDLSQLQIFSSTGRLVFAVDQVPASLDVSSLAPGLYHVRVNSPSVQASAVLVIE